MAKNLRIQSAAPVRSQAFNLDNGSGTTVDEALLTAVVPLRIVRVYALYNEATQTVAAGNFKLGASAGGADYVAATAYENSKAVGAATQATLVSDIVPAGTTLFVRHTGVAITQTGTANIVVEFAYDE